MKLKLNWDALGIATSTICAIHCALLPLIVSSLPALGFKWAHNQTFEWSMIAIAFCVGCYSLIHGFKKHHRNFTPLIIFSIGFSFLLMKQFVPSLEYLFLAIAVIMIISAHYYNFKLCNRSKCTSSHHKH